MSHKKPEPLMKPIAQRKCTICGHASYSVGGVHPQCNRDEADKLRRELRAMETVNSSSPQEKRPAKQGRFNISFQAAHS